MSRRCWVWMLVGVLFAVMTSDLEAKKRRRKGKLSKTVSELTVGDAAPQIAGKQALGGSFDSAVYVGEEASQRAAAVVVALVNLDDGDASRVVNETRKIDAEWGGKDVVVVLVATNTSQGRTREFVLENAVGWPFLPDPKAKLSRLFGAQQDPKVVIVDSSGVVVLSETPKVGEVHERVRLSLTEALGVPLPWGEDGRRSTLLSYDAKYQFGRPPSDRGASVRWQPLAMFMGDMANAFIATSSESTYEEYEKRLLEGEYEIANAGPAVGYRILQRYEPVVSFQRRKRSTYRGIIFTRSGSGVSSIEDLRGKSIALVSPRSTSGGAYPASKLISAGLVLEEDVRLVWVKTHKKVAEAVRDGLADAGACYEDCRDSVWKDSKVRDTQTGVVAYTDDIPTEMIFLRRDLPVRKRERLRAALLSIGEREFVVKAMSRNEAAITGVAPADPRALERVARTLEGIPEAFKEARLRARERAEAEAAAAQSSP